MTLADYVRRRTGVPLGDPAPLALSLTFVACGALHDLVTTAVRGSVAFLFTPWFFLLSLGLLGGRFFGLDFSNWPWPVRAGVNLTYLGVCLGGTLALKSAFAIP